MHGNSLEHVTDSYKRYLENVFRKVLRIEGTPIAIEFKTGENPFKDRKNELSPAQLEKRRRMVQFHKKRDKR